MPLGRVAVRSNVQSRQEQDVVKAAMLVPMRHGQRGEKEEVKKNRFDLSPRHAPIAISMLEHLEMLLSSFSIAARSIPVIYFICVIVIGVLFLRFLFWALCFGVTWPVAVTFAKTKKVERWPFSFVVSTNKQASNTQLTNMMNNTIKFALWFLAMMTLTIGFLFTTAGPTFATIDSTVRMEQSIVPQASFASTSDDHFWSLLVAKSARSMKEVPPFRVGRQDTTTEKSLWTLSVEQRHHYTMCVVLFDMMIIAVITTVLTKAANVRHPICSFVLSIIIIYYSAVD
jgi:hypothetical protein